jgi:mono/diheme cytochrome c family protein
VKPRVLAELAVVHAALLLAGCGRAVETAHEPSPQVAKLDAKFQAIISAILADECGTPTAPRLPGSGSESRARLRQGAAVYARNCRQCHGVSGGGNGPAARFMLPRPRNYRPGIFKFTSTVYGARPLREDLVRTVRRGIAGTSMPSFDLLPAAELEAVVDYVLALTHRGELETLLSDDAELEGQIDPKTVPEKVNAVLARWKTARTQVVYPTTPMPELSRALAQKGKEAFLTKGCSKCHGDDGRGQTRENIGVDGWGFPTKAADLTSGMLRGGTEALDLYRHIDAGINGTPMPSFRGALAQEPETIWNLVAYVFELSNERRSGKIPEAGILKPLPGVEKKG